MHILTFPTQEVRREDYGERWCFTCRKRLPFTLYVIAPVVDPNRDIWEQTGAFYGPHREIRCSRCNGVDADCFPGTAREWEAE